MRKVYYISLTLSFFLFFLTMMNRPVFHQIEFKEPACIKPHKQYHYLTCEPIEVDIDGHKVIIPAGMDTDLASIPKWLWSFIAPANSAYISPAILHDFLYHCPLYTRQQTDDIFWSALIENNAGDYSSYIMYLAVRAFGWKYYQDGSLCITVTAEDIEKSDSEEIELQDIKDFDAQDSNSLSNDECNLNMYAEEDNERTTNTI